jgi:hypothetical protein
MSSRAGGSAESRALPHPSWAPHRRHARSPPPGDAHPGVLAHRQNGVRRVAVGWQPRGGVRGAHCGRGPPPEARPGTSSDPRGPGAPDALGQSTRGGGRRPSGSQPPARIVRTPSDRGTPRQRQDRVVGPERSRPGHPAYSPNGGRAALASPTSPPRLHRAPPRHWSPEPAGRVSEARCQLVPIAAAPSRAGRSVRSAAPERVNEDILDGRVLGRAA